MARKSGALTALPLALRARLGFLLRAGDFDAAVSLGEEMQAVTEATGSQFAPYSGLLLAAWRGREEDVARFLDEATNEFELRGEGQWRSAARWARAFLYNGLGRPRDALASTEMFDTNPFEQTFTAWTLVEIVEAAAAAGESSASATLERLRRSPAAPARTGHSGSKRACGRCSTSNSPLKASTGRRSNGWGEPECVWRWHAPI